MKKLILPAIILFSGWVYFKGQSLSNLKIELVDLYTTKSSITNINAVARVALTNNSSVSNTVKNFTADVIYKNNKVAKVFYNKEVDIKANAKTIVDVPFSVPVINVAGSIADVLLSNFSPVIKIKGFVKFSFGYADFDITKNLRNAA